MLAAWSMFVHKHMDWKRLFIRYVSYRLWWEIHILSHTLKKILSTFQCNWSYGLPIEIGIVSEVSSRLQLGLSKISR